MQIQGSRVFIFGGWGLVGAAICRKIMKYNPAKLIVSSLKQAEAENAVKELRNEFSDKDPAMFVAAWGNIFTRTEWKDENWFDIISDSNSRKGVINDIFMELDDNVLNQSALYSTIKEHKPDVVIDCINTATAIAYLDTYNSTINVVKKIEKESLDTESVERLIASTYIPQLIRHIQILYRALTDAKSTIYLKVGTSGTGGMGMNIPYTHSEERPSRVLLSKTAVAGAQTLLMYLMARVPDGPIIKEVKPTATIAWKRIAYDTVYRKGQPIKLVDMNFENAKTVNGSFVFDDNSGVQDTGDVYKSVFIDTGENGIFSRGEFQAISSLGQMEIVTPEEIADYAVFEIRGGNTGHDMIQGLDAFNLGPTYRGGMLQNIAISKIDQLEKDNDVESVAFELLGPPRLSKLLYEAHLIKKIAVGMKSALSFDAEELSKKAAELIKNNDNIRRQILSIGLAVLLPDGNKYLRGEACKIPVRRGEDKIDMTPENINRWCYEGWLDLRKENFVEWQRILAKIIDQAESIPIDDTSSRYTYTRDYWNNFETIDPGKIAGWIFEHEDKGWRFKR